MRSDDSLGQKLSNLRMRLALLGNAWSANESESLLEFFVGIIPKVMEAERCSIFVVEPGTEEVWLKLGTGMKTKEITALRKGTVVGDAVSSGRWVIKNDIEHDSRYYAELAERTGFITRNLACAPMKSLTGAGITGAIEILNKLGGLEFTVQDCELLQEIADHLSLALENILLNEEMLKVSDQLKQTFDEICGTDKRIIAESSEMRNILDTVRVISTTPVNVLIRGESGTGKELIARMIYEGSDRKDKPFVAVNCASIPEYLMESEFFGYEKGAFTGAVTNRKGYFEEASGGTLFLDEIGDMPLTLQPKFLRAIQESEGKRLGSSKQLRYDLRIISATNKDLRQEVAKGNFREDLFYRLFSVEIHIPPLRERREDIVPLAIFFLDKVSKRFNKKIPCFSPETISLFEEYPWNGNVRQVLTEVERLVALTPENCPITLSHCSPELKDWKDSHALAKFKNQTDLLMPEKVRELEIICIKNALLKSGGNKVQASRLLGITRQGLDKKIRRYHIGNVPA